jgi:hypothetical protein
MTTWTPTLVVVQGVLEWPDGETQEICIPVTAGSMTHRKGASFRGVRVFVAHQKGAVPYNTKVRTTEGTENVAPGATLSYAGVPLDVPIEAPKAGTPLVHDRLKVVLPSDEGQQR